LIKLFVLLAIFLSIGGWSYAQKALDGYGHPSPAALAPDVACEKPDDVVSVSFSKTSYPHIRKHQLRSIREGWPSVYTINRKGADARRDKALEGVPTKKGFDRDEMPPAMLRRTWRTHVALVPSSENRAQGAVMGIKLRRYCDGTKVKFVWY
jgi:hypothetical protein